MRERFSLNHGILNPKEAACVPRIITLVDQLYLAQAKWVCTCWFTLNASSEQD